MRFVAAMMMALILACTGRIASAEVPHPPLEEYGDLPFVQYMSLSPDGNLVAFVTRKEGSDYVTLYDSRKGKLSFLAKLDNVSTRDLWFADNEYLIIKASDTKSLYGYRGDFEYSAAYSLSVSTKKLKRLLANTRGLYPAQSGLGRVVGRDDLDKGHVFMPAYMGDRGNDPDYDLLRVDLGNGSARPFGHGQHYTQDWFVGPDGVIFAREDYNNARNYYRIVTYINGQAETIYEQEDTETYPFSLVGVKADKSALIIVSDGDTEEGYGEIYEMDFSGNVTSAGLGRSDKDISNIYTDANRFVVGVKYSGDVPSYKFFDPDVDAAVQHMVEKFPGAALHVQSWSEDWSKILYLLYNGDTTGSYILQDSKTGQLARVSDERNNIPKEAIGQVISAAYPARDGLTIPMILTWPAGADFQTAESMPLIVMPHGGPASYDEVTFDWMAQYFANRGYLVFQPNFRGSDGYGTVFRSAGDGEWGRKMQDDITDGVRILIDEKLADPDRICIVGASYGGYAALAGGAYTPDLYDCVVAIAPVTDIARFIRDKRLDHGRRHWVIDYWKRVAGDPRAEKEKLEEISPVNAAENFTAPVLLIHGKDDTVVDFTQSRIMERALERAGKDVTFVELKDEDHWLSQGETRIETLKAMSDFVDKHIGE